jgi:ribosomal protein S18 acetylase RimI-like enzyme
VTDPFAARLRADTVGTDAAEALPGGLTRLRCARFPNSYDLNAVWAPRGADQATVDAAVAVADRRVWLPEPAAGVQAPAGWEAAEERMMVHDGASVPEWPARVARVDAAVLRDARLEIWRDVDAGNAPELADRQVALDALPEVTTLAVLADGAPAAWCTVIAGAIDDVWTQPAQRRRGHARAVVRAAVAAGGRHLTVDPGNAAAIALYAAEGFADAGRLVGLLRG